MLVVDTKDDRWVDAPYARRRAETRMRQPYERTLHCCLIPRLYGWSLLRVYCGDKVTGELAPNFVDRPSANRVLLLDFLEGQWDLDIWILETKVQKIVAHLKAETANFVEKVGN